MKKISLLFIILFTGFSFFNLASAENKKIKTDNHELNFYAGNFDFSDTGAHAIMYGVQHQNDDFFRNGFGKSFLKSKISPITGGFITEKGGLYLYTGAQAEYDLGLFTITPSFAPGYYSAGDGKDLGYPLEFKTEVQVSLNLWDESTEFGMSYNHISNASMGTKNPGANSYIFNFLKEF